MTSKKPAIEINRVRKTFRTQTNKFLSLPTAKSLKVALDSVSLKVPQGQVFGFLGPNGAGKTTLIKTIVGLLKPDSGEVYIYDKNGHSFESTSKKAKLRMGYLPERPYYHEFLSSEEFLHFHGTLLGLTRAEIDDKIPQLLKKVGLSHSREQKLKTFSKGMLQRIGFAQALLHDPDILILDEPMSGLDPVGRREVRDIILEIASGGKTIFFSTHIIHDVEIICNNVGFIQGGVLKGSGTIDQLLGKTIRSMEIRYHLPEGVSPFSHSRKTMDGWVLEVEGDENKLEAEVQEVLKTIFSERGIVRSVVPRRSTLEDLFFKESKPQ